MLSTRQAAPADQAVGWNGAGGSAWVEAQDLLDRLFRPIEERLAEAVRGAAPRRLLDVGCGTGATTVAAARAMRENGQCVGIDISAPMIEAARRRATAEGVPADFIRADAQRHAFEPSRFDMIVSRFGVMFFDDFVGAFINLLRAARPGADLRFFAWRGVEENPFMTTAERAAAPLLPDLPVREPDAPGQFAFADQGRVRRILVQSGWGEVELRAADIDCSMTLGELRLYVSRLGPLGLFLNGVEPLERERIVDAVLPAFAPFVHEGAVRFTAACWQATARAV